MKKNKSIKFIFVFLILIGFVIVYGISSIHATDFVAHYDNLFSTGEFTIYTDAVINDTSSLETNVGNILSRYGVSEYYHSSQDSSYLYLNATSCDYSTMKCNISLDRTLCTSGGCDSQHVNDYSNTTINVVSNLSEYYPFLTGNNLVINYDESLFSNDMEKQNYISNYMNTLGSYNASNSVYYSYSPESHIITRVDSTNSLVTRVAFKTIASVVFDYSEPEYSDEFKALTSGTLTIKSDSEITTDLLSDYLSSSINNYFFTVDGGIVNGNKVYIKMMHYSNGSNQELEKHLVTLVQDENIDMSLFTTIGYGDAVNIPAPQPASNVGGYVDNYFNTTQFYFELDNNYSASYREIYRSYMDPNNAIIRYSKSNSAGEYVDVQYHKVPVQFGAYTATSQNYENVVGDEVVINADSLNIQTINSGLNHTLSALGCDNDFSYCDIALYDNDSKTVEIHRVKMVLNNVITDEFIRAFNIKNDGTIDIIIDDDVDFGYSGLNYSYYDTNTQRSLSFSCDMDCRLTLYGNDGSETHTVEYNPFNSGRSVSYSSSVKESIDVYPGELGYIWSAMSYSSTLFNKDKNSTNNIRSGNCDSSTNKCIVYMFNADKVLEIHNSNVVVKEGRSPEFNSYFPGTTVKLNSVYKNDDEFLDRSSLAYLMSKTNTWSYMNNFNNDEAVLIYDGMEAHTMNVEFAQGNDDHQAVIDEIVDRIETQQLKIVSEDLEFVNSFYYNDSLVNPASINYNSKALYEMLSEVIDNKHVSYFFVVEGGLGNGFTQMFGGKVVLYYDGIAYGITNSYLETAMNNVIYIPSDTADSEEAFIAAAQARIDNYFGPNSGVVISYSRPLDAIEAQYMEFDLTGSDGNVYQISYQEKNCEFIIIRNSAKINNATFSAVDASSNASVSSDNANYPANTIVSVNKVDDNSNEYAELLERLGLDEADVVDINLFSPSIGQISNFSNVSFNVSLPISDEMLNSGDLYAYYIRDDGTIEEHPIVLDDFIGNFSTDHFSTYIISQKVDSSILNPNTSDNLLKWILIDILAIIGFLGFGYYIKKYVLK